jgi:hypothetical protein
MVDTGLNACSSDESTVLDCGGGTVHAVTYDCVLAPCCFQSPACVCATCDQNGTYLECH